MNATNAKDYLPLVQALAEGKTIQTKGHGLTWSDVSEFNSDYEPDCYRIKPEPRRYWLLIDPMTRTPSAIFLSKKSAEDSFRHGIIVEVVETLK